MRLLLLASITAALASAQALPIRVNCGGPAYTDSAGNLWSADTNFTGGGTYTSAAVVTNTADSAIYQSQRYGMAAYTFAVPNGLYAVTLKFAEIAYAAPGQRVFSVAINGPTVLYNFDIFAQAGGENIALDESFTVAATFGQIVIDFTKVKSSAEIQGIQIVPVATSIRANFVNCVAAPCWDSPPTAWPPNTTPSSAGAIALDASYFYAAYVQASGALAWNRTLLIVPVLLSCPGAATSGAVLTCTATLGVPAAAAGTLTIAISNANPNDTSALDLTAPASVPVSAGATTVPFKITANMVINGTQADVVAVSFNGDSNHVSVACSQ